MRRILIIFAHPAKSRSKINKALRGAIENLDGVTINDLYSNYPDFDIDIKREQQLCESHDVIIFQHPLYWYSTPAIMKEWQDLVLEHGWAYGSEGSALDGKLFLQAITGGGDDSTYLRSGDNHFTINELTSPLRAMARLCKMQWLPPFTVLGIHRGLHEDEVKVHADNYLQVILGLRDGTMDLVCKEGKCYLNSDQDEAERQG